MGSELVKPDRATTVIAAMIVMTVFAFSIWTSLLQPSGAVFLAWVVGWGAGSGAVAIRWRHWSWLPVCTGSMLAPWLVWTLIHGQTAWQSMYVFMFTVVYVISAAIGGAVGLGIVSLLQRRRARQSGNRKASQPAGGP